MKLKDVEKCMEIIFLMSCLGMMKMKQTILLNHIKLILYWKLEEISPIVMSYSIDKAPEDSSFFVNKNPKYANSRLYDGMTYQLRTDLLATYAKLLKGEIEGIPVDREIYDFVLKYLLNSSDYDVKLACSRKKY